MKRQLFLVLTLTSIKNALKKSEQLLISLKNSPFVIFPNNGQAKKEYTAIVTPINARIFINELIENQTECNKRYIPKNKFEQ